MWNPSPDRFYPVEHVSLTPHEVVQAEIRNRHRVLVNIQSESVVCSCSKKLSTHPPNYLHEDGFGCHSERVLSAD